MRRELTPRAGASIPAAPTALPSPPEMGLSTWDEGEPSRHGGNGGPCVVVVLPQSMCSEHVGEDAMCAQGGCSVHMKLFPSSQRRLTLAVQLSLEQDWLEQHVHRQQLPSLHDRGGRRKKTRPGSLLSACLSGPLSRRWVPAFSPQPSLSPQGLEVGCRQGWLSGRSCSALWLKPLLGGGTIAPSIERIHTSYQRRSWHGTAQHSPSTPCSRCQAEQHTQPLSSSASPCSLSNDLAPINPCSCKSQHRQLPNIRFKRRSLCHFGISVYSLVN